MVPCTVYGVVPGTVYGVVPGTAPGVVPGTAPGVVPGKPVGGEEGCQEGGHREAQEDWPLLVLGEDTVLQQDVRRGDTSTGTWMRMVLKMKRMTQAKILLRLEKGMRLVMENFPLGR